MEFSDDWKSVFAIGTVFSPPLLVTNPDLGPLVFNPDHDSLTSIYSSPSLSPPVLNAPSRLSLPRFITTSTSPASPVPPSTASSIAKSFLEPHHWYRHEEPSVFGHNRLQLLKHPSGVVVFFSTGCNNDQVGFLLIADQDKNIVAVGDLNNSIFTAKRAIGQRIVRIVVNPSEGHATPSGGAGITIGYLLVYTLYSVHWFRVRLSSEDDEKPPRLDYLGCKLFKSCAIAGASWNPHLPEESAVILEDGSLFIFDLTSVFASHCKGRRVRIQWDKNQITQDGVKWLGCEFSWHPRILILACSRGSFIADLRFKECKVNLLADARTLSIDSSAENDEFLAFCKSSVCDFQFVLVSGKVLLLCDIRRPLSPLLQWVHGLANPEYVEVLRLSELRANSRNESHRYATSSGAGIVLGSFWKSEFSLFCYGPPLPTPKKPFENEIAEISKTMCAWDSPSVLMLSGNKCCCSMCLVKEEFWRDSHPDWVPWQQKKEIILGFGILSSQLQNLDSQSEFGGFTIVRLMSSGTLESERYFASWEIDRKLDSPHEQSSSSHGNGDVLLYDMADEEYKFSRRFKYLKLDYLRAYLNGTFSQVLDRTMAAHPKDFHGKNSFCAEIHKTICEKLKICGFDRFRSAPAVSVVFDDINTPTSIHEIALRKMWSSLPIDLLQLAFTRYAEVLEVLVHRKRVSLEFPAVPRVSQLPPFFMKQPSSRSNKWSQKAPLPDDSDSPVGPVLPLPFLITLHELRSGYSVSQQTGFSPELEISNACKEVMEVADDMVENDEGEGKRKPFLSHIPSAVGDKSSSGQSHTRFVAKILREEVSPIGEELFDDLCPIQLKFESRAKAFSEKELRVYQSLKRQFSMWQNSFHPYNEFLSQIGVRKDPS